MPLSKTAFCFAAPVSFASKKHSSLLTYCNHNFPLSGLNGSTFPIDPILVSNVIFHEPEANLLGKLYSETIYAHDYDWVTSLAAGPIIISVVVQDITSSVSSLHLGSPEYDRTSARNFRRGLPLPATSKGLEKWHSFNGMTRWIKTVIDDGTSHH